MKLAEAQKLTEEILDILRPLCERVEIAGSIRRKKAEVHDVDIVLIPKPVSYTHLTLPTILLV